MPPPRTIPQLRLDNIITGLTAAANTLGICATSTPGRFRYSSISLEMCRTVKQNKDDCTQLMEQTYELLSAIITLHINSETGGELPPRVLRYIGKFTETLLKIHTFVEAQQKGSKVKRLFRQGEMNRLLKECRLGLQEELEFFQVHFYHTLLKKITHFLFMFLILDNLETVWEPAGSREEIEEFLSLLTDLNHLGLIITMRGAERPAKVQWTRPFLQPLKPLAQSAARQTFIDIADTTKDPEEVDRVLSLKNNMPLAINLLAHLVDSKGCSHVLSLCEEEKTSLISKGYDRRDNLDLSISLSLLSPRIEAFPHSRDLLSLLSILPDGLSDVELLQSKLPIDDILACKAALIRTAVAYSDEHQRLKTLVPIREYMYRTQPPGDQLVRPLFKYFQDLLELYIGDSPGLSSQAVARKSSNYSNIQNVLRSGFQPGHPDLKNSIYYTFHMNSFSRLTGRGTISLLHQIPNILPQPCDYKLEVHYITELFHSCFHFPVSDPDTLRVRGLRYSEKFDDDTALKCRFYTGLGMYDLYFAQNVSLATDSFQRALSLAVSTGNTRVQSIALYHIAWINWQLGDYSTAQQYAQESQWQARISADLLNEAKALSVEAQTWTELGGHKQNQAFMIGLAVVHLNKSEYAEAGSIYTQILEEVSMEQDPYRHALALFNLAQIHVQIDVPQDDVQRAIDVAKSMFNTRGSETGNRLHLREQDFQHAKAILQDSIRISWGKHSDNVVDCLKELGDIGRWGATEGMSSWTIILFIYSLKLKQNLGICKALQFLGVAFLTWGDEDTAMSLFSVALDGFTGLDVHRSRGECIVQIGDIYKRSNRLNTLLKGLNTRYGPLKKPDSGIFFKKEAEDSGDNLKSLVQ
ncbi:hypothetical protein B0H13DRAFT_1856628 [Mycena leptocephala]|nr:hypothetical protein B0H13DRAFT_1856628 [Mycena leptocephala]